MPDPADPFSHMATTTNHCALNFYITCHPSETQHIHYQSNISEKKHKKNHQIYVSCDLKAYA